MAVEKKKVKRSAVAHYANLKYLHKTYFSNIKFI